MKEIISKKWRYNHNKYNDTNISSQLKQLIRRIIILKKKRRRSTTTRITINMTNTNNIFKKTTMTKNSQLYIKD